MVTKAKLTSISTYYYMNNDYKLDIQGRTDTSLFIQTPDSQIRFMFKSMGSLVKFIQDISNLIGENKDE